ncbi:ArsR/SmtB family transcription factor [Vreelandella sp. EE7]
MSEGPNIVRVAALIGDNTRAEVLSALMSGCALTATELADTAGVTKQTISFHLGKLLEAELLAVEKQGRHRYFRLAGPELASLLESLMGLAFKSQSTPRFTGPRDPALRKARICYDHLAGELGVAMYERMLQAAILQPHTDGLTLTDQGRSWFMQWGIDADILARAKRPLCRTCLDWSERRHHLAGALGSALLTRIQALGWARREHESRIITFSEAGEKALWATLALPDEQSARAEQSFTHETVTPLALGLE